MDLVVAGVGTRMPAWVADGWREYARRMPPHLPLQLVEVPVAGKAGAGRESSLEAERLFGKLPERVRVVVLEITARPWSTEKLASRLEQWQLDGDPVWFLIGGADGLHSSALERADERWSLGPATLPHMLVRVLVAEQLYRASTILSGHPYHRA
ncbi:MULTISPECIES: 23S rRNA (pseudouridine(1915)-N(3))-methyltransferase RlmH [unclassified Wenzhouxiangella]|uniref:23S rRNA (pseudouridine(1915)-N(3))-methyltransferase RlmH n=1 Tax=unclassified Wenzhouxiangella TaxID=2613841 RepID=UPI000E326106|nr:MULTISPECIES: 23S rRNA (pseudouridine(1915)-N(3))-methyltransferase RlmH [unclassified Wenzhouxiangella]RFF28427.1 23S rRNA (pseudouridine(1915)-N(3))-methyltransferase RlmH [Wenzhouxiangella sp. 15181]RFP69944.1 23S rRNA (pseudouridine(1915)-N(3))-methyltransferase RlmH [Wenzhouxiangella sp. 15190]